MILCTAERLAASSGTLYVLECRGGRYYVGFTRNLEKRLEQHFSGAGAKFTQIFRPLRLLVSKPGVSESDEYVLFVKYAKRYGTARVGGWNEPLARQFGFAWKRY